MLKVTIAAIGRARGAPEAVLVRDYLTRFDRAAPPFGIGPAHLSEFEARKGGMPQEAKLLLGATPNDAFVVTLDERGKGLTSPEFAQVLSNTRDDGRREVAFIIGGADGLDPSVTTRADMRLSFGRMVWPHMLARVMLAEQLYRAATILGNSPYHRE